MHKNLRFNNNVFEFRPGSRIYSFIFALIILSAMLLSCEKKVGCDSSVQSLVKLGFYKIKNDKADTVSYNDVTVYGVDRDSMLYDSANNVESLSLPLSQLHDSCAFILKIGAVTDTLDFRYTRTLKFISTECGFSTTFRVNDLITTHNIIDTIYIVNPSVNTIEIENIKIIY